MKNENTYDSCAECGPTMDHVEDLEYIRTTAIADYYRCPNCDKEGFSISTETDLDSYTPPAQNTDETFETLSKDQIDFIKNLSHEMKTQDNMDTAQPFAFLLTTEQKEYRPDGIAEDNFDIIYDGEAYSLEDFADNILQHIEDYEIDNVDRLREELKNSNCIETVELWLIKYELSDEFVFEILNYELVQDCTKHNTNFFLTKKAYDEHIRLNGHNLNNPKLNGKCLSRNPEMEKLYEIIHKLAEVL